MNWFLGIVVAHWERAKAEKRVVEDEGMGEEVVDGGRKKVAASAAPERKKAAEVDATVSAVISQHHGF